MEDLVFIHLYKLLAAYDRLFPHLQYTREKHYQHGPVEDSVGTMALHTTTEEKAATHLALIKEGYNLQVQLFLQLLLCVHRVAVSLQQVGCTRFIRPLTGGKATRSGPHRHRFFGLINTNLWTVHYGMAAMAQHGRVSDHLPRRSHL